MIISRKDRKKEKTNDREQDIPRPKGHMMSKDPGGNQTDATKKMLLVEADGFLERQFQVIPLNLYIQVIVFSILNHLTFSSSWSTRHSRITNYETIPSNPSLIFYI